MDKRRQELEELKDDIPEAEKAFDTGEITIPQEVDDASRSILSQTAKVEHPKKSTKTVARYLLVAAATVIALLGTMIAVQAAGINVFGRLASWTDSVFHYDSGTKSIPAEEKGPTPEIKAALDELDLPVSLAPVWLPDGYTVVEVEKATTSRMKIVGIAAKKDSRMIQVSIEEHLDTRLIDKAEWEKNAQSAEIYTSNGRAFYLFENDSGWSGVWSDGRYAVSLLNFESCEALQTTIASIGVN